MLPVSTGPVAAKQDLIIRADSHSLRSGAGVVRDGEGLLDRHAFGIDHRNATGYGVVAGAADFRDADIEFPGPRAPLARLGAVLGLWRAVHAVKRDFLFAGVVRRIDERGDGKPALR